MSEIINSKIKKMELVKKSDFFVCFIDTSDLVKKVAILPSKAEWKEEQDKIVKFQVFDACFLMKVILKMMELNIF